MLVVPALTFFSSKEPLFVNCHRNLGFLTLIQWFVVFTMALVLLYNIHFVSVETIVAVCIGFVAFTVVWTFWLWKNRS
jgi:hypothetical protein